jgi:hypothetical protein
LICWPKLPRGTTSIVILRFPLTTQNFDLIFSRTLANYLMWRVSSASVGYLNEAARNL